MGGPRDTLPPVLLNVSPRDSSLRTRDCTADTDNPKVYFTKACAARGAKISVILRDRDVVRRGLAAYRYRTGGLAVRRTRGSGRRRISGQSGGG